jgi:hypothetical protein
MNNLRAFGTFRVRNAKMLCNVLISVIHCESLARNP